MACLQQCSSASILGSKRLITASHRIVLSRRPIRSFTTERKGLGVSGTSSTADASLSTSDQTDEDFDRVLDYGQSGLQGPRENMEDYTSVIEQGRCGFLIAAVFDGHSGPFAAEWLNNNLYNRFSDAISKDIISQRGGNDSCEVEALDEKTGLCCPLGVRDLLAESFEKADRELLGILKELEDEDDRIAGATATVVLLRRDKIIVANVGDSRAVLSRQGQPIDLSTEHRVTGNSKVTISEIARVESTGGWIDDGRVCDVIAVSRAFGDSQFKEPEGREVMLKDNVEYGAYTQEFIDKVNFKSSPVIATPDVTEIALGEHDEFLIVASDGLWDVMTSKDVVTFARSSFKKKLTAQQIADKLTKVAILRHTVDNVSVVVVDLGGGRGGWGKKSAKKPGLLSRMFG